MKCRSFLFLWLRIFLRNSHQPARLQYLPESGGLCQMKGTAAGRIEPRGERAGFPERGHFLDCFRTQKRPRHRSGISDLGDVGQTGNRSTRRSFNYVNIELAFVDNDTTGTGCAGGCQKTPGYPRRGCDQRQKLGPSYWPITVARVPTVLRDAAHCINASTDMNN